MERVDLAAAFDSFDEQWAPRLAAEPNDQTVKLARIEGAFVWHSHPDSDELFLVREGTVTVQRRERPDVTLQRASCSSSRRASNTGPSPTAKRRSCCSRRQTWSTRETPTPTERARRCRWSSRHSRPSSRGAAGRFGSRSVAPSRCRSRRRIPSQTLSNVEFSL
ncbi:MAG: cupin domain protein [halophilic archaeon J07HB67]|nr:MAG: cupin domain protein [halophilic archaeon J07HB67]